MLTIRLPMPHTPARDARPLEFCVSHSHFRRDRLSIDDDAADAFAGMHQVEALLDFVERQRVGNHRVDGNLPVHIPIDDLGHICAPFRAAKRRPAPVAARHQLERAGGDFLAGFGHADDDPGAPALVAAFQRLAHDIGIAGAIKAVIRPAIEQFDQMRDDICGVLWVDEVGHAELLAPILLGRVEIDTNDAVSACHSRALNDVEANAAKAEHHHIVARLYLGRVHHRSHAGRHAASDVAGGFKRRVGADFRKRDFGRHGEV